MPFTTAHIQASIQSHLVALPQKFDDRKMQESLRADFERLQKQFNGFRDQQDKIMKDPRLTPKGQQEKLVELATQWMKEVAWWVTKAADAGAAVTRLRAIAYRLPVLTIKRDPVIQFFREQELRLRYCEQTEGQRFDILVKAMASDPTDTEAVANEKAETIQSLLDAPGGPLVSADLLDRAQRLHAEQTRPDVLATLKEAETLLDQLQGLADHINLWLKGLGINVSVPA